RGKNSSPGRSVRLSVEMPRTTVAPSPRTRARPPKKDANRLTEMGFMGESLPDGRRRFFPVVEEDGAVTEHLFRLVAFARDDDQIPGLRPVDGGPDGVPPLHQHLHVDRGKAPPLPGPFLGPPGHLAANGLR